LAEPAAFTTESYRAGDGYELRYRRYQPAGAARACVVCLHGIQSHAGWYPYSCGKLAAAGFDVCFLDRRGAGMNAESRGDTPTFRRLIDDVAEFLLPSRRRSGPPQPVFLVAISWGGKLGVGLQRRHPGLVDGLTLLCPGICPQVRPPFAERVRIALARLTNPTRLFPVPLSDPELFTASPQWQQFIRDDPLALREATARLLIESVRLDGYLRFAARSVHVPVLLMLADNDRIIDNARTRRFVARFPSPDVEVIEYPGAQHTLEFEPAPEGFVEDLIRWISKHLRDDAC
jgi:alpha-beta hydrolase superfamily lysophospholipase